MRQTYLFYWKANLLTGILLALGLGLLNQPAVAQEHEEINLYNTAVDVRVGGRYFQRQCSRCHGADAKGTDETGAPDLTGTISRASTDFGIYNIIRKGIQGTAMLPVPADTPDPKVWQLVAYINSLRINPANIDLTGSPDAGQSLFTSKGSCSDCHMIGGTGGRRGPDLSLVGQRLDPDELKIAMTNPDELVDPRWWTMRITQKNGSVVEGLRMEEDTFSLRVIDENADLWSFRKNEIQSYERVETSTMPSYTQTLTEGEIDDLVAYLFSLRKDN
ncbi:MAG: c-type cytochrome [Gammaproteobacteria bacterium]|nr:c-type cytochrome [Gammaproteobacteria bacterium]